LNQLKVNTNQNLFINYKLASIGERILAYIIDIIIIISYVIIVVMLFTLIEDALNPVSSGWSGNSDTTDILMWIIGFLVFTPLLFYHLLCEQFMNGQSIGKKAMKIRVVKVDGSQPTFGNYFIRWLLRVVDGMFNWVVGIICILVSDNAQRLGDLAANTVVIKNTKLVKLEDMVYYNTDEKHEIKYASVLKLNDREIELIRSIVNQPHSENKPLLITQLATKIRSVLEVNIDELSDAQFLNQVLKDYTHQSINS